MRERRSGNIKMAKKKDWRRKINYIISATTTKVGEPQ